MQITKPKKLFFSNKKIIILLAIVAIVAASSSIYFFLQYNKLRKIVANPSLATEQEAKYYAKKVSRLITLPDEEPTIMTITDKEKLQNQEFFRKAKNGDKVLIFKVSKKAILYDPVADRILEVGPLVEPTPTPESEQDVESSFSESKKTKVAKIVLYNGTSTIGLTQTIDDILKDKSDEYEIIDRDNAKKTDYEKTLVIDLTGDNKSIAKDIADLVSGDISAPPDDEEKPAKADILIIVGEDKKADFEVVKPTKAESSKEEN